MSIASCLIAPRRSSKVSRRLLRVTPTTGSQPTCREEPRVIGGALALGLRAERHERASNASKTAIRCIISDNHYSPTSTTAPGETIDESLSASQLVKWRQPCVSIRPTLGVRSAMDAPVTLAEPQPNDAHGIVRAWRDLDFLVLGLGVPDERGVVVKGRVFHLVGDLQLAIGQRIAGTARLMGNCATTRPSRSSACSRRSDLNTTIDAAFPGGFNEATSGTTISASATNSFLGFKSRSNRGLA